ncbi:MAG: RluA family pseudouridine synthase [Rubripirellula sp.]
MDALEVLYEDNHLLVVNKPAGIATMGAESGPTIHSMAADYLRRKYNKPGRVFVGIVSRLDTMTSGALVLARTSKAASRLSAQFAAKTKSKTDPAKKHSGVAGNSTLAKHDTQSLTGDPRKIYLAVVEGELESSQAVLSDQLRKDDTARRMRMVGPNATDSQLAELRYSVIDAEKHWSLVAVELMTGRKHQIRVQFADRGHPVIGDRKYKSNRNFPAGIALHSWQLQILHPTQRVPMWFEAPLPRSWKAFRKGSPESLKQRVADSLSLNFDGEA